MNRSVHVEFPLLEQIVIRFSSARHYTCKIEITALRSMWYVHLNGLHRP